MPGPFYQVNDVNAYLGRQRGRWVFNQESMLGVIVSGQELEVQTFARWKTLLLFVQDKFVVGWRHLPLSILVGIDIIHVKK